MAPWGWFTRKQPDPCNVFSFTTVFFVFFLLPFSVLGLCSARKPERKNERAAWCSKDSNWEPWVHGTVFFSSASGSVMGGQEREGQRFGDRKELF